MINGTYVATAAHKDAVVTALRVEGQDTKVTITGGYFDGGNGGLANTALNVRNAEVTIKDGYFTVGAGNNNTENTLIYARHGAKITIEGGTFKCNYEGKQWTLNCLDVREGVAQSTITVKGGRFYKFDPANASTANSEFYVGPNEVVVPEGYKSVKVGDWYYVVPENATAVASEKDLLEAAANAQSGDVIYLTNDLNVSREVAFAASNITIEGCGHTIASNGVADKSGITVLQFGYQKDGTNVYCTGVTVQNLTITGSGKGALRFHGGTSSVLNNVTVSGNWWLAVNLYGTHGAVMNNCNITSNCTTKYCSASIFANEASANQLILNNTTVDSVFVNAMVAGSGVKLVVNDGSVINEVHSNKSGGASRTYWEINGTGFVGKFVNDIDD